MAETNEPPPLFGPDDDETPANEDDDDLFVSASQPKHLTNGSRAEVTESSSQEKPKPPDSPKDEKEDLFADAETEIPLDSPGHERKAVGSILSSGKSETGGASLTEKTSSVAAENVASGFSVSSRQAESRKVQHSTLEDVPEEQSQIEISVSDPKKVGDGMNAYMVYKVVTKSSLAIFRRPETSVYRRFSDFLGLHEKLVERHLHLGHIIPPPPEKSVIGMTKIKMSKEESGSTDFVEKRRASLERFVNHIGKHAALRNDQYFVEFLERDGDLPKSSGTSSLSGAGVLKLFSRVGDSFGRMTFKMDETDQWFEEKFQQVEVMEEQLKKLHAALEALVANRKELAISTGVFARSAALLANAEEHTGLSRVLSQLAEVEEKVETHQQDQADRDFFVLCELAKDYVGIMGAVKEVFQERVKTYKAWKDAEAMLTKKREAKVKLELARKTDKVPQAEEEIKEWEGKVEKGSKDFDDISAVVRREVVEMERLQVRDFRSKIINYLEGLANNQQQIISVWETFLPEVKSIV